MRYGDEWSRLEYNLTSIYIRKLIYLLQARERNYSNHVVTLLIRPFAHFSRLTLKEYNETNYFNNLLARKESSYRRRIFKFCHNNASAREKGTPAGSGEYL